MKRGGSLSFLVGTISNVLVMEIGWTDVGSGGYILVSCAHSNTSFCYIVFVVNYMFKFDLCLLSAFLPTIQIPEGIKTRQIHYTHKMDLIKMFLIKHLS